MSDKIKVTVTSDTFSTDGRRVDYIYTDPTTKSKVVRSLLKHPNYNEDMIVSEIEAIVEADIIETRTRVNATPLISREIIVDV